MRTHPIFRGAATALITPLTENGIDFENFGRLIDWQIEQGTDALVICGTTGEGSTLSDEEHRAALKFAIEAARGRVPMIAGTGSNDTAYAISLTQYACELGYDGMLVVTPYYNKATQNGLVTTFTAIADASTKPLILYNVPSRTGVNIEPSTYAKLADHPMIAAIKEAGGNISKIVETRTLIGDKLDIYSGNDDQIVPILACGGSGVISVLANVVPHETSEICRKFFEGDIAGSMAMQCEYLDLIKALFCEVNPIPVKAAMAHLGWCQNYVRLPLTQIEPEHEQMLLDTMRRHGIEVR
jgi:4-hydroxy-tetrahydrodipicolinate synthase